MGWKNGIYVKPPPPPTQTQIDAGVTLAPITEVYLAAGDLAELRCIDGHPPMLPLTDLADDDAYDDTITVFCMAPASGGVNGK